MHDIYSNADVTWKTTFCIDLRLTNSGLGTNIFRDFFPLISLPLPLEALPLVPPVVALCSDSLALHGNDIRKAGPGLALALAATSDKAEDNKC